VLTLLIIDTFDNIFLSNCNNLSINIDYVPNISPNNLLEIINKYHILLLKSKPQIDKEIIEKASNLKLIIRAGSGTEHIDKKLLSQRKIKLVSTPEGNKDSVGEQAIGMILSLLHNIQKSDKEIRAKLWDRNTNIGTELGTKIVGIIGYGNTGGAFAKKLNGFGCKIIAYDKYKTNYSDEFVMESDMQEIFEKAAILSLHIPLNNETKYLVSKAFIEQFKKPFWFLNLSRGEIVNTEDLIFALENNQIKGAGLDVFENENFNKLSPKDKEWMERLSNKENVILTPHIGGSSKESVQRINQLILQILKDFIQTVS